MATLTHTHTHTGWVLSCTAWNILKHFRICVEVTFTLVAVPFHTLSLYVKRFDNLKTNGALHGHVVPATQEKRGRAFSGAGVLL